MPMKKTWLLRVSEIRQELLGLEVPVVDRLLFERLFHVRRRRALQLMNSLGGFQTGQALVHRSRRVAAAVGSPASRHGVCHRGAASSACWTRWRKSANTGRRPRCALRSKILCSSGLLPAFRLAFACSPTVCTWIFTARQIC